MAIKDTVAALLRRMEEGTEEIYARYREKARETDAAYQTKLQALDSDYDSAARDVSGKSEVKLRERLTDLADLGLTNSGAAQQARISADTALTGSLGELASQHVKTRAATEAERTKALADLDREGTEKAGNYRDEMLQAILKQENADREYEESQRQYQEKMALEREKLALQKQNAAQSNSAKQQNAKSASGTEKGMVLDQSPSKMMSTILEASRRYNEKGKYYYVDRKTVQKAVKEILEDTRLTMTYRYQLYAEARARGYVA